MMLHAVILIIFAAKCLKNGNFTPTMKILICANIFRSRIVGPAVFASLVFDINERFNGAHEIHILSEDISENDMLNPLIHHLPLQIPNGLGALDIFFRSRAYYRQLKQILPALSPDVVLFTTSSYAFYTLIRLDKTLRQGRFVGMINDYMNIDEGGFIHFEWSKNWLMRTVWGMAERFSARRLDQILTASDFLRHKVIEAYHLSPEKVNRLYQAIDLEAITPKIPRQIWQEPIRILFLKTHFERGGLLELAAALRRLPYQFSLTIIGTNDTNAVEKMFHNHHNIEWKMTGRLTALEVYDAMYHHDILCTPSRTESLGLANIEGLACGISVVSTTVGGIPEAMGDAAWLTAARDVSALTSALAACISASYETRLAKSEAGKKRVNELFNAPTMQANFIQLLDFLNRP